MLSKVTFHATFIALCIMLSASAHAIADAPRPVDIPAGDLSVALLKLSKQYGADLVYRPEQVHGLKTRGARGSLTTEQAVTLLLQGTPLELRTDLSGAMLIAPVASSGAPAAGNGSQAVNAPSQDATDASKEGKKDSSQEFRLAQVDQAKNSNGSSVADKNSNSQQNSNGPSTGLTEIIVTAQKKSERLQDVPVPVTAFNAQTLVENNQLRLQDYYITAPGLSVVPVASNVQNISIRGITTGSGTNPTVGITVDDVPYGSSTGFGGSGSVPDFDPGDLSRVEVLRGPQGTLYGASSMGGLVKYVTVDPSTDGLSGRVEAGLDGVHNGAELGYNVRGSVNVPIGDQLAVRASAFSRIDAGYIDNVQTGRDGVNRAHVDGGRLSALWSPADQMSLKLSALFQEYKGDGTSDVDVATAGYTLPPLGDLQQSYLAGAGGYDRQFQAYSATLKAKLGSVDLTAVSGYNVNSTKETLDLTYILGACALNGCGIPGFSGFGVAGAPIAVNSSTKKFSQEVRLSASIGQNVEWLAGAFYTHENSPGTQTYLAANASTGAIVGNMGDYDAGSTLTEYAVFADVTFRITSRFDLQVGGRESRITQTASLLTDGPVNGGVITVVGGESTGNAFTYLVTPRFKLTPDLMVYARLASGYRAGGPNTVAGEPAEYSPDKTQNYEIGMKGAFIENKLSVDLSLYYIDWNHLQAILYSPNFAAYTVNGKTAKSQGIEFSVEARPLTGLTLGAWAAYDDATLTADFPAGSTVYGVSGDRLPYTSRLSGSLSLQQEFPLWDNVTGVVGATDSYLSDRLGVFASQPCGGPCLRQSFPSYLRVDLRAGVKAGTWSANFFATNVADKRAATEGGYGSNPPFAFNYIQPRTIGVNVVKSF